ncbi:MAG TPA: transposase [Atribacteraceae bacterium]|nr:transposase [Atribacteraceae bacterium]
MTRPLRLVYPGAVYHLTSRGNARGNIYREDLDRETFTDILALVVKRYHWLCHAYCLMDNHYHLLVETPEANLCQGMRQLNGIYTQRCNRKHGKPGHLFQGRYKAILVDKENYLLELCRYVVLNPVRARWVELPEQWQWGSYQSTAGLAKVPEYLFVDWILGLFGTNRKVAREHYRTFVRAGIHGTSPWEELEGQVLLGGKGFVERFTEIRVYLERNSRFPWHSLHDR